MSLILKFKLLNKDSILPSFDHADDAGFGIYSYEEKILKPMEFVGISTGISSEIPSGHFVSLRDRSSMAIKGLHVMGGVIDAGYRGEWKVVMINLGNTEYKILKGDKIAQGILQKLEKFEIKNTNLLSETKRGSGGFGSTGR